MFKHRGEGVSYEGKQTPLFFIQEIEIHDQVRRKALTMVHQETSSSLIIEVE